MLQKVLLHLVFIFFLQLCSSITSSEEEFSLVFNNRYATTMELRVWYTKKTLQIIKIEYDGKTIHEYQLKDKRKFDLTKLNPCTTYEIKVRIRNETRKAIFYHNETFTTKSRDPKIEIKNLETTSDSVNVSLQYDNPNCINSREILLNNEIYTSLEPPNKATEGYHLGGLNPCTTYNIGIKIYSVEGGYEMDSRNFKTKSIKVPPIENIVFDDKTGLITWDRPVSGQTCIKIYEIRIFSDGESKTYHSTVEEYYLINLTGCAKYRIFITPNGLNNETFEKSETKYIHTGIKEPSQVENLVGTSNSTSISISWHSPTVNPACVKRYKVICNGKTEYTDLTEHIIYNLEPCLEYRVQVCLIKINDEEGNCGETILNTTMGMPDKITKLHHSFTNSVNIYWDVPVYGRKCVKKYRVSFAEQSSRKSIYVSYVDLPKIQLSPNIFKSCQNYTVSVLAVNYNEAEALPESTSFTTETAKPVPPASPSLISQTAFSLELKSVYHAFNDYCELQTASFRCTERETGTQHWSNISIIQNERQFTANVTNLKNLTKYLCDVSVGNDKYFSDASAQTEFETNETISDPPQTTISSTTSTSFTLNWSKFDPRIKVRNYHVKVIKLSKNYKTPDGCQDKSYNKSLVIQPNVFEREIIDLEPYPKYTVEMAIENTAGISNYSKPIEVITEPYTPHQVKHFHIAKVNVDQTMEIKWILPCEINGQIDAMAGTLYEGPSAKNVFEYKSLIGSDVLPTSYVINYFLKPEHSYNVTIRIQLKNYTGPTNLTSMIFTTPAGIPDAFAISDWGWLADESNPPNHINLTISKQIFSSSKGNITKYTFVISERVCNEDPIPSQMIFINKNDYPRLPTWDDVVDDECTRQYQLQEYENSYNFHVTEYFPFIVGDEQCDNESWEGAEGFCNGPLKSGTEYAVMARVFTSDGYADTQPIFFTTDNTLSALTVIFISLSILLVGFFIGIGYMRFKMKHLSIPLNVTDIAVKSFLTFYSQMEFDLIVKKVLEFETINQLDLREYTTNVGNIYKDKNRYVNILPYDQNRVILTPNEYCTTGYINASYIDGYKKKQEYIASQGPKPETCYDFWHMIIETKCHKIVMLTKLVENDTIKCFQYYPDVGAELEFNDIKISNIKEDNLLIFTRRELKISKGMAKRLIVQYHLQTWPDHGCPENEMDLIKFLQFLKSDNSSSQPVVVHCSAGVGRTGTLISLDMLMQQIQNDKYLNIYETVKKLRYQRVKMVQTFEQYEFLYKSVAKYIQWKWPSTKS